jgi:Short C-terminal domain/PEGA domain
MKKSGARSVFSLIVVSLCFFAFCGCATIIHGTTQDVPVSTKPEGATAKESGGQECTTPCKLTLKRKEDHAITIHKDGYQEQMVTCQHVVSGAVAGNILAGGLIGWGVDAMSGGQYRLVPETISVELHPIAAKLESPGLAVDKIKALEELKKDGAITEDEYNSLKRKLMKNITSK